VAVVLAVLVVGLVDLMEDLEVLERETKASAAVIALEHSVAEAEAALVPLEAVEMLVLVAAA
jgi:hypothetical protein